LSTRHLLHSLYTRSNFGGAAGRLAIVSLALLGISPSNSEAVIWSVGSVAETSPLAFPDDTCIWIHPNDREKSVVLGTNKNTSPGGIYAWSLSGGASIWDNSSAENGLTNNVDLRYGFPAGPESWDIVCSSNRSSRTLDVYRIETDENEDFLGLVKEGAIPIGDGWASGTDAPYGCAMFQTPTQYSCLLSDKVGNVGQFHLQFDAAANPGQRIIATRVAFWDVTKNNSEVEGIVADDPAEVIYIAAEDLAIYRFETANNLVLPATSTTVAVPNAVTGPFVPDVEGLTIWYSSEDGEGYLIASSQGHGSESSDYYSTFAVFERSFTPGEPNAHIFNYELSAGPGSIDEVTETDGIDVANLSLGATYASGIMVAHDEPNDSDAENFKFASWKDIATAPDSSSDYLRFIGDGSEAGWDPRTREGDVSSTLGPWPIDPSESALQGQLRIVPQPFSKHTTVHFAVGRERGPQRVRVSVFNIAGREVSLLAEGVLAPGDHSTRWDGTDGAGQEVPAGAYWIRVAAGGEAWFIQSVLIR